jgi:hypothetical protein
MRERGGYFVTGVIHQPSYIPWRGYFHQIQRADVFVFYDDVQYDKHGWRNRNRIKTANGVQWLTIPVHSRGCVPAGTPIKDIRIDWSRDWAAKHWATIKQAYGRRAPHFSRYAPLLEEFYQRRDERLADFVIDLTMALARELNVGPTRFLRSSELGIEGDTVGRLIAILQAVGATHYVSGPAARDYMEPDRFAAAGITLEYMVYDYPPYAQLHAPYDSHVSILDLLVMHGPAASEFIWDREALAGQATATVETPR